MNPQEENTSNEVFQSNLLTALNNRGWTQLELAQAAGLSQGMISNYLTARRSPSADNLHRLAISLGVSMEWLLAGETPAPTTPKDSPAINPQAVRKSIAEARAALDKVEKLFD